MKHKTRDTHTQAHTRTNNYYTHKHKLIYIHTLTQKHKHTITIEEKKVCTHNIGMKFIDFMHSNKHNLWCQDPISQGQKGKGGGRMKERGERR